MSLLATLREAATWFVDRWRFEADPESLAFDETHGVDTAGWTLDYEPVRPSVCRAALEALPESARSGVFVDLGCGKGRALLIAAGCGFERVVGVEHVASLALVAHANAATWRTDHPDASPIDVLHDEATRVELPRGNLVLFLYNPFSTDVMQAVLTRVRSVADRSVHVVYVNPLDAHLFEDWTVHASGGEAEWAWRIYALAS